MLLKCLELGYPRRSFRSIQATKALRAYERTTAAQHLAVAKVLSASSDVRFSDTNDKPGPSSNVCGIPGFATTIGTASHCVINVNMGQP